MGVLEIYYLPLKRGDCSIPNFSIPQILRFAHAFSFMATCSTYGIEKKQLRAGTATTASTMNKQGLKAQNFKKDISPFPLLTILGSCHKTTHSGWERWKQRLWQENWDTDFVRHCSSSGRFVWWSHKPIFMCLSLLISEMGVTISTCHTSFCLSNTRKHLESLR